MIQRIISRHPLAADLLLLLVLGGLVLFSFLGQNRHWASREIRHAEIMREMAETGDFLIPRLLGEVYYDKPPVMHVVGATLMRVSGEPNLFHARFPSALAALLSLFAVYGLGRMLGGRLVGLWGSLALLSMPGFWNMARIARPDLTLVALTLLSCLFLGWAMRLPNGGAKIAWLVASGVSSALGVITKGPYGVMVPLLFLAFAPRGNAGLVRPRWRFLWFGLGLVFTLIAWSCPVYLRDGGQYLRGVIFQEDLSTAGGTGHYAAVYWYLGPGFLQTLPVILLLPFAIRQWRQEKRLPAALLIAAAIFLIISCVPGKRRHYILPFFPFLALALAEGIAHFSQTHQRLRWLAIAIVAGGVAAGPLYYGPILYWLQPHGDTEWSFITQVAKALPPNATVVCFGAKHEHLAWVRRDHRRIIGVGNLAQAKSALLSGDGDQYLVVLENDLRALEQDLDVKSLRPLIAQEIDRKGRWLLVHLDK